MKISITQKKLSVFIFVLSFLLLASLLPDSLAASQVHEIYNFNDLMTYAELSRQSGYENHTYILQNDITITSENQATIEASDYKYISFGSSDVPFTGTFDGNGYTIYNLTFNKSNSGNKYDTGLISQTSTGAVIKDLTISDANIDAIYRGGIVVGSATGTRFENVTVKDSHISLSAADNIVTLITDGGVRGGSIVGDATNSVLYNCESDNNFVNINNTSGVAALSGKALTLGALVGISDGTTVEYSRAYDGLVKNYYDVAVGAVSGNSLYVGGLVGQMRNSSKVIDSFSTATLNYYCGTYISVGAGNVGYIGGITGKMDGDTNEIYRSHYAGVATSRQYNAALLIPVIQDNKNISGITESYGGGAVVSVYFKPSLNPDVTMKVLGNSDSTSAYGPLDDQKYVDMGYWESQGFDFSGTQKRNTAYNNDHYNKWVIDTHLNIPVHGKSLSATLDFKGAGTVTIGSTYLISNSVSTTNPYVFATQGMTIDEDTINLSATENTGYKFIGWYKIPKVNAWQIEEDYTFFEDVFSRYNIVSNSMNYSNVPAADNNLFVAKYKTRVTYHDINGNLIDSSGTAKLAETDDDYYNYNDSILNIDPYMKPANAGARLIGWTTVESTEPGKGYSSITSTALNNLKSGGNFYEVGDKITKTMSLYPVYIDSISNINIIFEGNELDSSSNVSLRQGVGEATITATNNQIVLDIIGADNNNLPSGYRFLGWYDSNGNRLSKNMQYDISDIDLTTSHTYEARFEYKVDYFVGSKYQDSSNNFADSYLYETKWMRYNEPFENIPAPAYIRENISHWGTSHYGHGSTDSLGDAYSGNITEPVQVFSHNYALISGNQTGYDVSAEMDFPGSGSIVDLKSGASVKFQFTPLNNNYNFLFWAMERSGKSLSYKNNPMEPPTILSTSEYKVMAFVTGNVTFHQKDDTTKTVQRRYQDNIFMNSDQSVTYYYPFWNTSTPVSTRPEDGANGDINNTVTLESSYSDQDMKVNGYAFLGYISSVDVVPNSSEWNYLYDVAGDAYTTSSIKKATPYLMSGNEKVLETQDIYPVYAKYNIETRTNVDFANLPNTVNVPSNPTYVVTTENATTEDILLTVDNNTYVTNGDTKKYTLKEVTVTVNGVTSVLTPDNNGQYVYQVTAGENYVFTAKYEPYILLYHTSNNTDEVEIRDYGDTVGNNVSPAPNVVSDLYVFAGWTTSNPTSNTYHLFENNSDYNNSGISLVSSNSMVTESMELFPVYIKRNINVNSNIDNYLVSQSISLDSVYEVSKTNVNEITLIINNNEVDNYYFDGWYTGYVSDSNLGTKISSSENYRLSTDQALSGITYTAVYKRIYNLNYYGTDGNILEIVRVFEGTPRSFVKVEQDEQGNDITVPEDSSVFIQLESSLNQNENLLEWQWVKGNIITSWDDFSSSNISEDMNLYPVIERITAKNSSGNTINVTNNNVIDISGDINNIIAKFNSTYSDPTITFTTEKILYNASGSTSEALEGVTINLYKNTLATNSIANGQTDTYGNLLLNLTELVNISVGVLNNNTDSLIYNIVNMSNPNVIIKQVVITPGSSVNVRLPYGSYKIIEDENWAWRYSNIYETISINNQSSNNISFTNQSANSKWFNNVSKNKNVY